jgi:hypothetical protein
LTAGARCRTKPCRPGPCSHMRPGLRTSNRLRSWRMLRLGAPLQCAG